jgi:hypothetical protein
MQYFDRKLPAEKNILTFNMAAGLNNGNLLSGTPVVTISVALGTDPSPGAVLNGSPSLDSTSTMILQGVQGGVAGCEYLLEAECATTLAAVALGLQGILPVSSEIP